MDAAEIAYRPRMSYKARKAKVGGCRDYFDDDQVAELNAMVDSNLYYFNSSDDWNPLLGGSTLVLDDGGEGCPPLDVQDVHLWLCPRDRFSRSDEFKRCVLARYAGVAPPDLQFVLKEHGKPALAGAEHALDFNLSHSGDWLACVVTAGTPVGVDLEFCDPRRVSMKVARRFFRKEEVAVLEACSGARRADRFYDFWTLKEAAIKARGEALAPGLASYGFELTFPAGEERGNGRIAVTAPDVVGTALYGLLEPQPEYRLALCWLPEKQQLPRLGIFELCEGGTVTERVVPLRASSSPG